MIPSCMIGQILQHIFTTSSDAKIEDLCQFRPRSIRRGVVFNFAKLFLDLDYKKRNEEFFFWFSSVGLVIIYSHCPIFTEKFLKLICKDKLIQISFRNLWGCKTKNYLNQNGKIHNNTGDVQNQTRHTSCHSWWSHINLSNNQPPHL